MCDRFTLADTRDWSDIYSCFGAVDHGFRYPPRYNISPGSNVVAIISDGRERRIGLLRWGLVPSRSNGTPGFTAHKARVETLHVSPSTRGLLTRKRCVVVADGFIDWQRNTKKPYRFRVDKHNVFGFAALYDTWTSPDRRLKVHSCSIITTRANWFMMSYTERMPVILDTDTVPTWLDRSIQDEATLMQLLVPYFGDMYAYQVPDAVGDGRHDGPECIQEVKERTHDRST